MFLEIAQKFAHKYQVILLDFLGQGESDSFEGEEAITSITEYIVYDREQSKQNIGARMFYQAMQGEDFGKLL